MLNADGTTTTYTIPSFGYLKSSINRIDNTIQKLAGLDGSDAFIRLPDGSYKRIYQAAFIKNPKPVGALTTPSQFSAENNWFFESLYTPALKVKFDVTPFVPQQESKIFVKRMLLNLDTEEKRVYFDENLKGRNDIKHTNLLVNLQSNNITYFLDEEVVDMPLSVVRYTGDFTVVNSEDREITNTDGSTSKKRWYLFNKLTYTDNLSLTKETKTLKSGDRLLKGETLYEIIEIDASTNYLRVRRLNGYEPFVVGERVDFYSETFSPKTVSVGIGFDEYEVIFFRTVNDEENIISTDYSPGVAFYTNDLTTNTTDGLISMKDFYQQNVLDFGNMLLTSAKEGKISAVDGLTPDAPVLKSENFKVTQINEHKLDQEEVASIRKKQSDKVTLESEITELEKSIDKKKEELNTRKFNSDTERRGVKNELDELIREKSSKSTLFASIVSELAVLADQKPAALDKPKYRIRGFFNIPNPKQSNKTGPQEVIQFYTYYRYVRPDGSQSDTQQYDFIDENGQVKKGTYSNLTEVKSDIRKKVYDVGTGKYSWATEDIENPEAVNINQVDIPITKGEKVEFYVVSVSEAGWPDNPLLSEGSNIITLEFPTDLVTEDEASIALNEAKEENVRVQLENDLQAKGLDQHLSSSFNAIEKYYAHDADVVSSNFYTPEGNVISLYEKLKEMQLRIEELENRLNNVAGLLSVYIIDTDNNTKTQVQNGSVISLFAGYYLDYVNLLPSADRRGAIVNKTYQIALQNSEATPLQLVSRFPGGVGAPIPTTLSTIPTFAPGSPYDPATLFPTTADSDYITFRKYDQTPIVHPSVGQNDTNNANKFATAFYQSGQSAGQFIWSRYKDVGLVNDLYQDAPTPTDRAYLPDFTGTTTAPWIWDGSIIPVAGSPTGGGFLSNFCIHQDHPELNAPTTAITLNADNLQKPNVIIDTTTGLPSAPESVSKFRHAYGFDNISPGLKSFTKQLNYSQNFLGNVSPFSTPYTPLTITELPDKFGFIEDDRYLVGKNTCGSYLFVGPTTFNQLNVNGIDARSTKEIEVGDNNAIVIPIVFQFRMEDYYGPSGGTGAGIVGGYDPAATNAPTNLSYGKRIGIDVYAQDEAPFSIDIQVSAAYKKTSLTQVTATAVPAINKELQNVVYSKDTIKTLTS